MVAEPAASQPVKQLEALRVPVVLVLASPGALALGRARVVQATALAPAGLLGAAAGGGGVGGGGGGLGAGGAGAGGLGAGGAGAGGAGAGAGAGGAGLGDGDQGGSGRGGGGRGRDDASSLGGEDGRDRGPSGLLVEVLVVEEGVTLAREGFGNPGVLVGEGPDGHADAADGVEAAADDTGVVVALSDESRGRGGQARVADVELGKGDLEAKGGEALQDSGDAAPAGGAADNQMALEANTVDGSASSLDDLDQLDGLVSLSAVVLQVVVVVVPRSG